MFCQVSFSYLAICLTLYNFIDKIYLIEGIAECIRQRRYRKQNIRYILLEECERGVEKDVEIT